MKSLNLGLSSPFADAVGWTLVHFLWQGLLLALLLQAILPLCRGAVARHNWALGTLAAMCLAPVITFLWLQGAGGRDVSSTSSASSQAITIALGRLEHVSVPVPWTGWLVGFWLAGVVLLSLRALGGLVLARRMRRGGFALPDELLQRCRALQRRLGMSRPVQFLQIHRITAPVVVGWLRPAILVPVSAIAGLTPQQLDALILHELAHIGRLDAFTNLMLMMAETILFYHPAIWWVSRRVRTEREHCCDDFAVTHCGDVAIYVEALTSLTFTRAKPAFALSANGGSLKYRVARLLDGPSDRRRLSLSATAGLAFLSLVIGTVATAQTNTNTRVNRPHFSIRVVDESVGKDATQGPVGDDHVRIAKPGKGEPGELWLKRSGQIDGDALTEAHASAGSHGNWIIAFRLTPNGKNQFAAMTRNNIGHRLAVVVNGTVITAPTVRSPILHGAGEISGNFATKAEANALAAEMMGTGRLAKP